MVPLGLDISAGAERALISEPSSETGRSRTARSQAAGKTMKAMQTHKFGGPEELCFEDAPEPQVQAGQVRIRVRAVGINPADLVRLAGRFPGLPLPYIPGTDVCGEVEDVGAG